MTPTLQQAIKLLQMTRLELQDDREPGPSEPVLEEQDPESPALPTRIPGAAETRERELAEFSGDGAREEHGQGTPQAHKKSYN